MKDTHHTRSMTVGLAIFSMLFGAGNIIYPIRAGVIAGSKNYIGILGFVLTGVVLPILGLLSMILFDGNYRRFFNRVGKTPGNLAILYCMLVIGPLIAMPRCITVPFEMLSPYLGGMSLPIFSTLFGIITFALTYKKSTILDILGKVISPALVGSLFFILIKGLWQASSMQPQKAPLSKIFFSQLLHGFQTLDLLGALFFAYIVLKVLKANKQDNEKMKDLAVIGFKGGIIGGALLAVVYIGYSFLGAYYAHTTHISMNGAQMFRNITLYILHEYSFIVIALAALMACFSTITALAAVFAEYLHYDVSKQRLTYVQSLCITLGLTVVISNFGLTTILTHSEPFIDVGYPIIIAITLCNLLHKAFDFKPIKIPVLLTAIGAVTGYVYTIL